MAVQDDENDLSQAGLSPEELAALNDDEGSDDAEALKSIVGDEEGQDGDEGADSGDGEEVTADDAADEANEDETETVGEFVPKQNAEFVADFDKRIADIAASKASLREQLNNGDIDLDQYEAKKDEISAEETALRIKQATAENAAKQNAYIDAKRWDWEQEQFFSEKRNAIYNDKIVMAALNAAVIDLAKDPNKIYKNGTAILNDADQIVRERFGVATNGTQQKPNRKPDLSKIPKTLSNLPAADTEQEGSGEFAHLEKLSGMELERAVAKLNPEQVQRYLTS